MKWIVGKCMSQFVLPCMSSLASCPQVSPDCPLFPTRWYNITIRGADGASVLRNQVEANNFTTVNSSEITVLFDTPLPRGMFDVEVFKVVTIPVKELNEEGIPVDTEHVEEWNSSSKATGRCMMECTHNQQPEEEEL